MSLNCCHVEQQRIARISRRKRDKEGRCILYLLDDSTLSIFFGLGYVYIYNLFLLVTRRIRGICEEKKSLLLVKGSR